METALTIFYTALFIIVIFKSRFFQIENISRKTISALFVLKVVCGILLAFIYTYYYKQRQTADIFKFFDDGKIIYNALFTHPFDYLKIVTGIGSSSPDLQHYYDSMNFWHRGFNFDLYNDYKTMIRFNAIACLFSFGHYTVHTVFMSFISFVGLTAILKTFLPYLKNKKIELLFIVFLIPSVILWSSGVLKEGFILCGLGLLIWSFLKLLDQYSVKFSILFFFAVILLLFSKLYVLISLIPGLISMFWIFKTDNKKSLLKFLIVHFLFLLLAFNIQHFTKYNFIQILCFKQQDFNELVRTSGKVGSLIYVPELKPDWISFIKNSPIAFVNTFFRPHIFESYSVIVLFSAIENFLLAVSLIITIFFIQIKKVASFPLFYFCISFAVITFILSGLTTPVMGALVRYKAPALPFLLISFLFLIDKEKFIFKINNIRKKFKKQVNAA